MVRPTVAGSNPVARTMVRHEPLRGSEYSGSHARMNTTVVIGQMTRYRAAGSQPTTQTRTGKTGLGWSSRHRRSDSVRSLHEPITERGSEPGYVFSPRGTNPGPSVRADSTAPFDPGERTSRFWENTARALLQLIRRANLAHRVSRSRRLFPQACVRESSSRIGREESLELMWSATRLDFPGVNRPGANDSQSPDAPCVTTTNRFSRPSP